MIEIPTSDGGTLTIPRDKVLIGNVSAGEVRTEFTRSLVDLMEQDRNTGTNVWHGNIWSTSGANISKARNEIVREFLATDGDWLLFLDSDMAFPPETILRLLATAATTKARIVGGLCVMLGELGPIPTLYQFRPDAITGVQLDYPDDSLVQVAATGCACLMVHREVFEAAQQRARDDRAWLTEHSHELAELAERDLIAEPTVEYGWFAERVRTRTHGDILTEHWMSEDIDFCLRMGRLGYKIFVDTGLSIGHAKHGRVWHARDLRDGLGMPKPTIAAVIPVKDRLDLTTALVGQLRAQGDCDEIIVCDNGSRRDTANWLASQDDITILDMAGAGIHEMWNTGLSHAIATHGTRTRVAFLNNDLELGPAMLRTLSQALTDHRELDAVCPNYDGRDANVDVIETTDICAGRYDGTGGFAGFAFMVRGEWFASGYRFPEECRWWFGDNDLLATLAFADAHQGLDGKAHKAGIVTAARVTHVDGGGGTAGDWSAHQAQLAEDRAAFEARWARITEAA